jgi:agmatine deiminase
MQSAIRNPQSAIFSMPAEWECHEATWLAWPHHLPDWPGKFQPVPWVFTEMARKLAASEKVYLIVQDERHEKGVARKLKLAGADLANIRFFRWPTNRNWTRDFGPICLKRGSERLFVDCHFNAWAKYPNWQLDRQIVRRAGEALGIAVRDAQAAGREWIIEGGGIDVNGRGTLLTTEECFNQYKVQVRNPDLGRDEMDAAFRENLGVSNVLWLGDGIAGDDTHGHVDDICRFVNPTTVVLAMEHSPDDANYRPLQENRERLAGMRLEDGSRVEVIELPMPAPLHYGRMRLPASYANFYIANSVVIVPTFNDPADRVALGILAECFPGRSVCGIHAVDLVLGQGTLHCLTQQLPS